MELTLGLVPLEDSPPSLLPTDLWKLHPAQQYCCNRLESGPPKIFLESENFALFGKSFFASVIKLRILRWRDYPGLSGWVLNSITGVLRRERSRGNLTHREGDVEMEQRDLKILALKTRVTQPQAHEC